MPFRLPTTEEKDRYVHNQFERIARRYDLANDIISFGMHRLWKKTAVDQMNVRPEGKYLDVCCGTGDLTFRIAKRLGEAGKVTGLDFSGNMLSVAERRRQQANDFGNNGPEIIFVAGDAQKLPFENDTFDAAIISFGLRNLSDLPLGISEMARVVKPGGKVINLDVGHPTLPVFAQSFRFYFRYVVPVLGEIIQKDRQAYTYLPESARAFPPPEELAQIMRDAGLEEVFNRSLAVGSVAMQVGSKA